MVYIPLHNKCSLNFTRCRFRKRENFTDEQNKLFVMQISTEKCFAVVKHEFSRSVAQLEEKICRTDDLISWKSLHISKESYFLPARWNSLALVESSLIDDWLHASAPFRFRSFRLLPGVTRITNGSQCKNGKAYEKFETIVEETASSISWENVGCCSKLPAASLIEPAQEGALWRFIVTVCLIANTF